MKEDVLEQIVDDYLQFRGYFTTHNVRFGPRRDHPDFDSRQDSVSSDVDVVGYHPRIDGPDRVVVVTCKAWQTGFDATAKLAELRGDKRNPKRATWHHFRELWVPKWSEAFRATIEDLTGVSQFTYRVAVTRLKGDGASWSADPTIAKNLDGCSFGFLTLEEMWATMLQELTTTPASSEVGRLAQLLKAARLTAPAQIAPQAPHAAGSAAAARRRVGVGRTPTLCIDAEPSLRSPCPRGRRRAVGGALVHRHLPPPHRPPLTRRSHRSIRGSDRGPVDHDAPPRLRALQPRGSLLASSPRGGGGRPHRRGSVNSARRVATKAASDGRSLWISATELSRTARATGAAATVNGQALEQWQCEVIGGGRLWYCIDDAKRAVWLMEATVGHPKATE